MGQRCLVLALGFLMLCGVSAVQALPSLSSQDMLGDIRVMIGGEPELVPVIRDLDNRNLFYYAPIRPRLAVTNGKPVFKLLKYQRRKSNASSELIEGGILQFAFSLALPNDALDGLKKETAKRFGLNEGRIKMQPLPMKSASLAVYSPSGDLLGEAPQHPQVAPMFASQLIPVQINLNTLGADVYDELCSGPTGVPVVVTFSFEGITPACGFKAMVNFIQCHQHVSVAMEGAGSGSIKAFGVAGGMGAEMAIEHLMQKKAVRVESLAGEAMSAKQIQDYVAIVLDKIMNELAEVKAPDKIIPANAKAGEPFGLGVGIGYKVKSALGIKAGITTFNMTQRLIADRSSVCGGFIGLGAYPESVRNELITILPEGNWQSAYFPLPDAGDASSCGVSTIDLTIGIVDKAGKAIKEAPRSQTSKWTAATGVWKRGTEEIVALNFPMMSLYNKFKTAVKTLKFSVDMQITYLRGNKTVVYKNRQLLPVFNGDFPVPSPMGLVDMVSVYNGFQFGPDSNVNTVAIKLEAIVKGKREVIGLSLMNNDPQFILVDMPPEKNPMPLKTTVTIIRKKGKPVVLQIPDVREWGNVISVGDWNLTP
jgi:hypothetical protein